MRYDYDGKNVIVTGAESVRKSLKASLLAAAQLP